MQPESAMPVRSRGAGLPTHLKKHPRQGEYGGGALPGQTEQPMNSRYYRAIIGDRCVLYLLFVWLLYGSLMAYRWSQF